MPAFAQPLPQPEARRQLNLDPHHKTVLILGGGLGLSVDTIAAQLLQRPSNTSLIVMPGRNSTARSSLVAQAATLGPHGTGRIHICDWTERMDVFIRAADIVVGKPGGISVAEVLACGRPLFATRSLGGQEGFNVRFLERHGVGALVADGDLANRIDSIINQPDTLADMQRRAWSLGRREGAARIGDLALDLAWRHRPQLARKEH